MKQPLAMGAIAFRAAIALATLLVGGLAAANAQQAAGDLIPQAQVIEEVPLDAQQEGLSAQPSDVGVEPEDITPLDDHLELSDVIASVYQAYPMIAQQLLERSVTSGNILEAYGAFDTKLQGYTLSEPTGFYRNYRNGIGIARQTWWGGYLAAGYRIGRGDFQPWYKERETNEAGEFKLAAGMPLLQGRAIDPSRVAVFQATLANQAVEPQIQQAILETSRQATGLYWEWTAAGQILLVQRALLDLALNRGQQLEVAVKSGKLGELDLIFNNQLIAERRAKFSESEQKLRASAFKLSLFVRDELGQPLVPADEWLRFAYPEIIPLPNSDFQTDLQNAMQRRPEPQLLRFEQRSVQLDQQLAYNDLLPRLDFVAEASQDAGTPTSSLNDKGQFELLVGVQGEVPIQRRKARGKIQSTTAKIEQLNQKLRLVGDKIGAELLTAFNALSISAQVIEQSRETVVLAKDVLSRNRRAFEAGSEKVTLLSLILLESKTNEAEIKLIEAQRNWFAALADMQFALGLDPLDQALLIDQIPDATLKSP